MRLCYGIGKPAHRGYARFGQSKRPVDERKRTMKLGPMTEQRPLNARGVTWWVMAGLAFLCLFTARMARAEDAVGILRVSASVPDARVHIDNEDVGTTPVTRYMPPGAYVVRVSADGYDPFVRKVTITANASQTLQADLVAGGGSVEFAVKPGGAKVFIDDVEVGIAPIRLITVPPGEHRYRVNKEGYEPFDGTFTLVKGGNPLISTTLESSSGRFAITSTPPGAAVYLDGERRGETPLQLRDIPPGEHDVALYLEGYTLVNRKVDTSDGSRGEVEATLTATGTTLVIHTGHSDGQARIDGIPVGAGRTVELVLSRGEHTLEVSAPGYKAAEKALEIPISGELNYVATLAEEGSSDASSLEAAEPLARRWTFWAALGGGAAGAAATATVLAIALSPDPPPTGEVVVTLP